ncbi:MAG: YceI family protein [Bacteroidota bacterium]
MRQFLFTLIMMSSVALMANGTNPSIGAETKPVNTDESSVVWTGKKVTGSHTGTINLKSGNLEFENGALTGGSISIDMNSIKCTDLEGGGASKLEGHLKSDDFFGVPNHPTADMAITKVMAGQGRDNYKITADVTIKGITKPVTFDATVQNGMANATIIIDRTDFDVRYGSGSFFDNLGDKTIYDDFELVVNLKY